MLQPQEANPRMPARVVIPIPNEDFEPTEVAAPWQVLRDGGVEVVFATPDGKPGACDPLALEGVVFKQIGATSADAAIYRELQTDAAFRNPIRYDAIEVEEYVALHLPGGHAPGMVQYLGSEVLQQKAAEFFVADKLVSAVCHGPVVLARAIDPRTGRSVLHGRRVTALTKLLERSGYLLTLWTLGKRFRTYPEYVQDEVISAVGDRTKFEKGPLVPSYSNPYTLTDGKLITARWPGDARRLGEVLLERIQAEVGRELSRDPCSG
jgi:putative intracellular protease/amidase